MKIQSAFSVPAVIALALAMVGFAAAQAPARHAFAQKLVASTHAQHPNITELGIELPNARGCRTIASTDPSDVGERCEADDIQPLKTGHPAVAKESDGYDVSLLLHDSQGRRVGVVGIEMKLAGQTRASALREAQQVERELAKQIPSKASLEGR